jgi:hypothetical protein
MFVVFLYGRPATGKYTIGKLVADELGIPLFHNHLTVDLVGTLFEFGTPEFIAMREGIWLGAFDAAAKTGQPFVFTFSPENTVAQETIDRMRSAVEGIGGRILFFELLCEESTIEERIGNKSREAFGKLTDLEHYRKLKLNHVFDHPVMPEPMLSVDTSDHNAVTTAKVIIEKINQSNLEQGC